MLTLDGLSVPGWEGWLLAVLLIVVVRPVACLIALGRSRLDRPGEKAFVAWFGVRGVGSLYYLAVAVGAGALGPAEQQLVVWTCIAAVLLSIVVHGITAGPSMRRMLAGHRQRAEAPDVTLRPAPGQPTPRAR
jgi:NhaP-type Na+/H+ or K+/H+ antiporter